MRRFTLLDAMILVAASAVVILGARRIISDGANEFAPIFETGEYIPWPDWLILGHRIAGLALLNGTFTLLVLRLLKPRPRIRRVMRQPGAVACFSVVSFCLMSFFGENAAEWWMRLSSSQPKITVLGWPTTVGDLSGSTLAWSFLKLSQNTAIPWIIATAWLALWLGKGRCEPSWIDRCGRAVGTAWIVWGILGAFH